MGLRVTVGGWEILSGLVLVSLGNFGAERIDAHVVYEVHQTALGARVVPAHHFLVWGVEGCNCTPLFSLGRRGL